MRRLLKVLVVLAVFAVGFWIWANEPRPAGTPGPAAEALAQKMLAAVDDEAWRRTGAVTWSFRGEHRHLWDRQRSFAIVAWGDTEVELDLTTRQGFAHRREGGELAGEELAKALDTAWQLWCNDSFWLNPLTKIYDEGTARSLVEHKDGPALLVEFGAGGVTPGDAYLFLLDAQGLPERWQMWTQILPIQGLGAGWEGWTQLATGARVATRHPIGPFTLELRDVRGAATLAELQPGPDPFVRLAERSR